jgi:hypothetical protein
MLKWTYYQKQCTEAMGCPSKIFTDRENKSPKSCGNTKELQEQSNPK